MNNTKPTCSIETKALTKNFGEFCALDHLDLQIPHQCIFGLLGPNGAGKSTAAALTFPSWEGLECFKRNTDP